MAQFLPRIVPEDDYADPFGEHSGRSFSLRRSILGGSFLFESDCEALLRLVEAAYGGLPCAPLPLTAPNFRIELRLAPAQAAHPGEPPPVRTWSGAGVLCGVMDAGNYAVLTPDRRRALVVASRDMLGRAYHLRYELIEFAVFVLAARGMGLVPLHGACVGRDGRGVLLLGASGAGKSTLALHALLEGMDFLAEDAVFVRPDNLLAAGVPNYLHVRADTLRFVERPEVREWIGRAPVIRRRSGVEKFEADLRQGPGRLAAAPLEVAGAVLVSAQPAEDGAPLLRRLCGKEAAARLAADQPYASGQPGWRGFVQRMLSRGVYELRRARHPRLALDALHGLLDARAEE